MNIGATKAVDVFGMCAFGIVGTVDVVLWPPGRLRHGHYPAGDAFLRGLDGGGTRGRPDHRAGQLLPFGVPRRAREDGGLPRPDERGHRAEPGRPHADGRQMCADAPPAPARRRRRRRRSGVPHGRRPRGVRRARRPGRPLHGRLPRDHEAHLGSVHRRPGHGRRPIRGLLCKYQDYLPSITDLVK
jgi:hypothetical protein